MYMLSSSRPSVKTDNSQKMNNKTTKDLDKWCNYLTNMKMYRIMLKRWPEVDIEQK